MPRYFFHIYDGVVTRDEEGIELDDPEAARVAAVAGIREMICDQVRKGRIVLHYRLEIEDQAGEKLFVIPFTETVRIEQ